MNDQKYTNWRFDSFEGYRWLLESEDKTVTIYGRFSSKGEPYFETSLDILAENRYFLTLDQAIQYHQAS
jgi:hypothetical protein